MKSPKHPNCTSMQRSQMGQGVSWDRTQGSRRTDLKRTRFPPELSQEPATWLPDSPYWMLEESEEGSKAGEAMMIAKLPFQRRQHGIVQIQPKKLRDKANIPTLFLTRPERRTESFQWHFTFAYKALSGRFSLLLLYCYEAEKPFPCPNITKD